MLGAMVSPFWRDLGFSGTQFGVASITVGKVPAIVGGLLGGYAHGPLGHQPGLVAAGDLAGRSPSWDTGCGAAGGLALHHLSGHPGESLAGQMGSAAFMAFLMSLCDKRFSASHYAFLSMLFGLSGRLCGYLGRLGGEPSATPPSSSSASWRPGRPLPCCRGSCPRCGGLRRE